jgi:transposase
MKSQEFVAGIDVSKNTLDIYFNDSQAKEHSFKVANDASGHQLLLKRLGTKRTYVLESSGPYYLKLAFLIKNKGGDVRVENPICIKRFIQMNLERNKSDQKDARWIYHYAKAREIRPWQLPSKLQLECQQLIGAMELYKHQLVMLQNQLHSLEQIPLQCKQVSRSLQNTTEVIEAEIEHLEQKLQHRLQRWQGAQMRSLSSIPGLGKRAVALLITYTDGFTKVQNHRQLIALAGMAPREYTSGTSIKGKRGICKMGNGRLRSVLYMCSLSAIRHNSACKNLYERLKAKGKNGKLALIAVCNKLLKQAFAVATKGTLYQPNYCSLKP